MCFQAQKIRTSVRIFCVHLFSQHNLIKGDKKDAIRKGDILVICRKLLELRERLKEYTGFDYSVFTDSIVEAFIKRIWVSKDEFRW